MNKVSKKYIKDIEKLLVGTTQQKQEFLKNISAAVEEQCEDNQNMTYAELCTRFGQPEVIAKELICDSDAGEIKKKVSVKKIVAAALAAIVLLVVALCVAEFADSHNEAHGSYNESVESGGVVSALEESK